MGTAAGGSLSQSVLGHGGGSLSESASVLERLGEIIMCGGV